MKNMKVISNAEFGGERPLFESHDLRLENVIIRAGESAIKEVSLSTVVSSMSADVRRYGTPTI